jgi:hypothetical protein
MKEPSVPTSTKDALGLQKRETVLRRLLQRFAHIPAEVSLAEELIAERRTESGE